MELNRRMMVVGGTVLVVVLIVIGSVLLFGGGSEHKLEVTSVPNDLTLTLDGKQIPANGEVKVKGGKHTLTGERRGFETYSQTIDVRGDTDAKVFLFANSDEGRAWEAQNLEQEKKLQAESSRRFDELNRRMARKYPILQELPYHGPGFTIDQGKSQAHPDDPEVLGFYIRVTYPEGRQNALDWLTGHGYKPETLELIWVKPGQ
ncbi:PEGA domain-containing protein [Kribbella sp. NPDC026611]|uniref:PEGA domain-containing protein n=1 Tax=Kribbella sp. NPDC026611 TaxID=3154911 RepID=UPI003406C2D0